MKKIFGILVLLAVLIVSCSEQRTKDIYERQLLLVFNDNLLRIDSLMQYDADSGTYYKKDARGYTLLARLDKHSELTLPATYDSLPVHTVGAMSLVCEKGVVDIESGVEKVEAYALFGDIRVVNIPISVTTIYAKGVYCQDVTIFAAANTKPEGWDSNWTNSTSVYYGCSGGLAGDLIYAFTPSDEVALIKYTGDFPLYIPSYVKGKEVTTIKTGFFNGDYAVVYIPASVMTIEYHSFIFSSRQYSLFYAMATERPENWSSNWYYSSYYGGNSGVSITWNTQFEESFID